MTTTSVRTGVCSGPAPSRRFTARGNAEPVGAKIAAAGYRIRRDKGRPEGSGHASQQGQAPPRRRGQCLRGRRFVLLVKRRRRLPVAAPDARSEHRLSAHAVMLMTWADIGSTMSCQIALRCLARSQRAEDGIRTRDPHLGKVFEFVYGVTASPVSWSPVYGLSTECTRIRPCCRSVYYEVDTFLAASSCRAHGIRRNCPARTTHGGGFRFTDVAEATQS